ncbi:hypothetical protein MJO29_014980 [Puccinia striiformis f. sp. tritici]|nr:hypothetical protein Pst134EB_028575 [Puccinia striiformis f. sp. tritici]KAI7937665.1 hypothetical protein MJO29_014980 [Puccinia striiformis f. sp. tritici]KAI9607829.1 hypothetical protein H4Q26_005275 [Puccinia striiformis f. sp. tritici PST-130]
MPPILLYPSLTSFPSQDFLQSHQDTTPVQTIVTDAYKFSAQDNKPLELDPGHARIAHLKSLTEADKRIELRIELLDTQSNPEFLKTQSQLEQLHRSIKPAILERVRRLQRVIRLSQTAPSGSHAELGLESLDRPSDSKPLIAAGKSRRLTRLRSKATRMLSYAKFRKSRNKSTHSSVLQPLLDSDGTDIEHLAASPSSPEVFETLAGESTREAPESDSYDLHGDILGVNPEHTLREQMETWNSLQASLIRFHAQNYLVERDAKFLLGFLKTLYSLGDLIHEYHLMPSDFIETIGIFRPKVLLDMVEYHIDLLFSRWQDKFFDIPGSVVPELEFLTTGRAVKHFNRAIEALPRDDQRDVVHLVLRTIMRHLRYTKASQLFHKIREELTQGDFLDKLVRVSSVLSKQETSQEDLAEIRKTRVFQIIELALYNFRDPTGSVAKNERLEFQLVFYMIDFIDRYYPSITNIMIPQSHSELYQKKLRFMRSYLNYFRHSADDYSYYLDPNCDKHYHRIARDSSNGNHLLFNWIITVTHSKIKHHEEIQGILKFSPDLNLWMGQTCWRCGDKFRECNPSCNRFEEPEDSGGIQLLP